MTMSRFSVIDDGASTVIELISAFSVGDRDEGGDGVGVPERKANVG